MIKDWREKFGHGDLGFYYVQLAPWIWDGTFLEKFLKYFIEKIWFESKNVLEDAGQSIFAEHFLFHFFHSGKFI
jgi:hypothetical protein